MAAVRISVGASSDGSMKTVFRPMVEAAREARVKIEAEFGALKGSLGAIFKVLPGDAGKAWSKITELQKVELEKQVADVRAAEKEKAKAREEGARLPPGDGGGGGRGGGGRRDNGYRTALGTVRYMDRTLRGAGSTAMQIARGAGVDLDLGSLIGKSVHMGKLATDLSNSGWQPQGDADARKRVPAAQLEAEARAAGNKSGLDPMKALEGMRSFVGITGDLKSARELTGDLGVLARATGTEFEDMVTAAAEVNAKLGDTPNKGAVTLSVMRAIAGQGKLGAIEIRQMATEMAKVGSASKMFNMAPDQAMQMMGVLMQEARQVGGAKNASVAANAAMSFVTNLTKGSTIKNLSKGGIQPWADAGKTKLLDPETIILASLFKTKGNMEKLGGMFKDKMSMTAVRGFATTYNNAPGDDKAKLQAVRDEFTRLKKAAMGQGEVMEQFNTSMATPEAQIQLFNNKLSEIGGEIAGKVLPALIQLGPAIISGVESFGKLVAWAAENPGKALAAALTMSIARAGIDSILRTGIESLFDKARGGGGAGGGGGKLGGALGALGTALTIAAAAVTIEQVGEMVIDKVMKNQEDAEKRNLNAEAKAMTDIGAARAAREGKRATFKDAENLEATTKGLKQRLAAAEAAQDETDWFGIKGVVSGAANYVTAGSAGTSFGAQAQTQNDVDHIGVLREMAAKAEAEQGKLFSFLSGGGVLKVSVVSGGAIADPSGTTSGAAK